MQIRIDPSFAAALLFAVACGGAAEEPIEPPTPFPGPTPFAYPKELVDLDARGETVLMVHVTTAGVVDSAYIHEPSPWPELNAAALAGAKALRFSPARQGARRIAIWARLPVRFAPDADVTLGLTETEDAGSRP